MRRRLLPHWAAPHCPEGPYPEACSVLGCIRGSTHEKLHGSGSRTRGAPCWSRSLGPGTVTSASESGRSGPHRAPPAYPIASVDNALQLLLLFRDRREWRLSDIAQELSVADSTAHRLIAMLEFHGFLTRVPRGRAYQIGPSIAAIGRNALGGLQLREQVHGLLGQIVEETGETVSLGVLEGDEIHYIDAVESTAVLRVGNRTGMRIPAHCTSAGKVLLAELDDAAIQALYPEEELPTVTAASLNSRASLLQELEGVRAAGYATSVAASEDGIASVSVPVRNAAGEAVAAAALAAPINRWETWNHQEVAARMREVLAVCERLLPAT